MIDYQVLQLNGKFNIVYFPRTLNIGVIKKNRDIEKHFFTNLKKDKDCLAQNENYIKKLMLNVTDNCNLKCSYCYASKYYSKNNMTKEIIDIIIDKLFNNEEILYVKNCVFFGGEPLINIQAIRYFTEKINFLFQNRIITRIPKYSIITNGTFYDSEIMNVLKANKIGVVVSIDGPDDIQNLQRPFKNGCGSHSIISKNIKKMKSDGIPISYESTITKNTIKLGYSESTLKEYFKNTFDIHSGVMVPENFTSTDKFFNFSKFSNKKNIYISALENLDFNDENFEIPLRLITKQPIVYPCGLGRNIFHILANGDIYPCQLLSGIDKFKISDISNFSKKEMYENSFLSEMKSCNDLFNEKCSKCWAKTLCKYCPARTYLETGKFLPSDKICDLRKREIKELILYLFNLHNDKKKMSTIIKKVKEKRSKYVT